MNYSLAFICVIVTVCGRVLLIVRRCPKLLIKKVSGGKKKTNFLLEFALYPDIVIGVFRNAFFAAA